MMMDEMTERIERAEGDAFRTLYWAAAACCGTGLVEVDGNSAFYSPRDDDPGYSSVIRLNESDPAPEGIRKVEVAARAAGARVLGINGFPESEGELSDATLRALGFTPVYQERMWGRRLTSGNIPPSDTSEPEIVRVDEAERDLFARVLNVGYNLPADSVRGSVFASTLGLPGWRHYFVRYDGKPGSASVLYVTEGVAQLFVATTMPEFRGRGGQGALIRRRLRDALADGCDLATSQTVIDNASPRNMARHGFQPLYDRWIYGKPLTESNRRKPCHVPG
jgi:hypothetical protein